MSWCILYMSIICSFACATPFHIGMLFNSDSLFLPYMYHNIIYENGNIGDWYPTFNSFIDFILYYILNRGLNLDFVHAHTLYAFVQVTIVVGLSVFIFKKSMPDKLKKYNWILPLFFSTFFIECFFFSKDNLIAVLISSYSYHTSEYMCCLLVLAVYLSSCKQWLKLILIFFLCFISVFSSILFLILLTVPLTLTLISSVTKQNWKTKMKYVLVIFFGSLSGILWSRYCITYGIIKYQIPQNMYTYDHIFESACIFFNQMILYISSFGFRMLIVTLSFFALPVSVVVLLKYRKRIGEPLKFLLVFFVFFMPIVVLTPIINGNYRGIDTLRYNVSALYFGLLIVAYFLAHTIERIKPKFLQWRLTVYIIPVILLCMMISKFSFSNLKNYYIYYPQEVSEIDDVCQKYKLKNGLAEYWTSKWATMYSKNDIHILGVREDLLCIYELGTDITSYHKNYFDFIVINNRLNEEVALKKIIPKKLILKDSVTTKNYKFYIVEKFTFREKEFCLPDLKLSEK